MKVTERVAFIRDCVQEGRISWTYHANMRVRQRLIARHAILLSTEYYREIEFYPQQAGSRYMPASLVRTEFDGCVYHALFALDVAGGNVRVITVYQPDPEQWDSNFCKRRERE